MSDPAFYEAVDKWLDSKAWPRNGEPNSVLVLNAVNDDGTVFRFHSGFGYFEVLGIYNSNDDTLTELEIILVVPLHPKDTTLTYTKSYALSTEPGDKITIDIGDGYIKGNFIFQYGELEGKRNIFLIYRADLPFAGTLDDKISIAPTTLSDAFTEEEIKVIPTFVAARPLGYAAASGAVTVKGVDEETKAEQELLVKFLQDFLVDQNTILIQTYNPPPADEGGSDVKTLAYSKQWQGEVSFLGYLTLIGSINPSDLMAAAELFADIPISGRVKLAAIRGSLLDGIVAGLDLGWLAKGSATFSAAKNASNGHDVFVDASLKIKFVPKISTNGKLRIFSLQF